MFMKYSPGREEDARSTLRWLRWVSHRENTCTVGRTPGSPPSLQIDSLVLLSAAVVGMIIRLLSSPPPFSCRGGILYETIPFVRYLFILLAK
jgi:hypothetical protein